MVRVDYYSFIRLKLSFPELAYIFSIELDQNQLRYSTFIKCDLTHWTDFEGELRHFQK